MLSDGLMRAALCCQFTLALYGQQPEYVGSEVCQACHEDIFTAFNKNPHHVVGSVKKFGREGQACESCHGPAGKHAETASAEDIRNPAKLRAGQTDQLCLKCHLNEPTHSGRIQSSHAKGQIACNGCHTIHKTSAALLPKRPTDINAQCSNCHLRADAKTTSQIG